MKLFKLFMAFFKIGFFTIGGGYAMLPLIQKEVVDVNGWLTEEEFLDAIAISQSSPGAVAVNISIFIGYRLGGLAGSIVSTLGTTLPSVIIILVVAIFLYEYKDIEIVQKIFLGIRPAVVSLIASSVVLLGKALGFSVDKVILAVVSFILIVFFDVSPIYIILFGGIISGIYYNKFKKVPKEKIKDLSEEEGEEK